MNQHNRKADSSKARAMAHKAEMTNKTVATSSEVRDKINAMFESIQQTVEYLAARWADESECEDIREYQAVIEKNLPEGFKLVKMTKRPFGFHFTAGTPVVYAIFCNSRNFGWKRLD